MLLRKMLFYRVMCSCEMANLHISPSDQHFLVCSDYVFAEDAVLSGNVPRRDGESAYQSMGSAISCDAAIMLLRKMLFYRVMCSCEMANRHIGPGDQRFLVRKAYAFAEDAVLSGDMLR